MSSAVECGLTPVFFEGFLVGFGFRSGSCVFVNLSGVRLGAEESTGWPRSEHVQGKLDVHLLSLVLHLQEDVTR